MCETTRVLAERARRIGAHFGTSLATANLNKQKIVRAGNTQNEQQVAAVDRMWPFNSLTVCSPGGASQVVVGSPRVP